MFRPGATRRTAIVAALCAALAASAALPAGSAAEVITPTVVKPQVVTPQPSAPAADVRAAPAPTPAAVSPLPAPKAAPAPSPAAAPAGAPAPSPAPSSRPAEPANPADDGGRVGSTACLRNPYKCEKAEKRKTFQEEARRLNYWLNLTSDIAIGWFAKPVEQTVDVLFGDGGSAPSSGQSSADASSSFQLGPASFGGAAQEVGDTFDELTGAAGRLLDKLLLLAY